MREEDFLKLYKRAEEENDSRAQVFLGLEYLTSKDRRDLELSYYWFLRAASQNDSYALNELGRIFEMGRGKPVDYEKAYKYYLEAASLNYIPSYYRLGMMIINNHVNEDLEKAYFYFDIGASGGNDLCMFQLGNMYHKGIGVHKNIDKAIEYYKKALDLDLRESADCLGYIYAFEKNDIKQGKYYFKKACDLGYDMAFYHMGMLYYLEGETSYSKAIKYLANPKLVTFGPALYYLGLCHKKRNISLSKHYLKMAADLNYSLSKYELAVIYEDEEMLEDAYELYLDAANNKVGKACFALGRWYREGRYVEKDEPTALRFYLKAFEYQEKDAAYEIAKIDFTNVDISVDQKLLFYKEGVKNNIAESAYYIGKIYEEGLGTDPDINEALKWYEKAKSMGLEEANIKINELKKK